MTANKSSRVVITGRSLTTPLGIGLDENISAWQNFTPNFSKSNSQLCGMDSVPYAGLCKQMPSLNDRKVAKVITRKDVIGLATAVAAAADANLKSSGIEPQRIGMFVGAGSTQIGDLEPYFELVKVSFENNSSNFNSNMFGQHLIGTVNPMVMLQTLMNNTLCYASIALDIRGVNANFMDFQVAAVRAVAEGYYSIVEGRADAVLVGGVAGRPEPFQAAAGIKIGFLAETKDIVDPSTVIRPFDRNRSGTILSEGAAFLVLESLESALKRKAMIYGEIFGFGFGNDAGFAFLGEEESHGLNASIRNSMKMASLDSQHPLMVFAQANGSRTGDKVEARALSSFFRDKLKDIPVHALKETIGEMGEAAPIVQLIFATEATRNAMVLPANKNFNQADEDTKCLNLNAQVSLDSNFATLITARSFSGLSGSILVGAYTDASN